MKESDLNKKIDVESNPLNIYKTEESFTHGSSYTMREPEYDERLSPSFRRFIRGFQRDPNSTFMPDDHFDHEGTAADRQHNGSHYYDLHLATLENAHIGLSRKLKGRHLQMIAIGGSIGMKSPRILTGIISV